MTKSVRGQNVVYIIVPKFILNNHLFGGLLTIYMLRMVSFYNFFYLFVILISFAKHKRLNKLIKLNLLSIY